MGRFDPAASAVDMFEKAFAAACLLLSWIYSATSLASWCAFHPSPAAVDHAS